MPEKTKNKFGTFGGFFTPAILTILDVIMFMRANFVAGHAGVVNAVVILVFAKLITLTTWHAANKRFMEQVPTIMLVNSQGGESVLA